MVIVTNAGSGAVDGGAQPPLEPVDVGSLTPHGLDEPWITGIVPDPPYPRTHGPAAQAPGACADSPSFPLATIRAPGVHADIIDQRGGNGGAYIFPHHIPYTCPLPGHYAILRLSHMLHLSGSTGREINRAAWMWMWMAGRVLSSLPASASLVNCSKCYT